ncbi:hypothetical protein BJ138DRAFT_1016947 [Hygrophoropsis aurantiaca]|uniref:Uncharacterized protein n=1 Tax=Hygrophoropsis aurantiaca TaxID=72124 RepID=A0ACB7ZY27_9AGAM|nr:hypothetical protein BJ138DRAFT_1016947 [Hygrophoropsis aurantiaca]
MKYPLVSMRKLLDVFGSDILYGYDIKCAFKKILLRSSLGPDAIRLNCQCCVPGMHGHAHNRLCQVFHHCKYKTGAGKEDFETWERTFSESNALALETQNSTEFHHHQALDEHFAFADQDKYAAVSTFIYNNYVQALNIIQSTKIILATTDCVASLSSPDFQADLEDEKLCLQRLKQPDESTVEVDYVKALLAYEDAT